MEDWLGGIGDMIASPGLSGEAIRVLLLVQQESGVGKKALLLDGKVASWPMAELLGKISTAVDGNPPVAALSLKFNDVWYGPGLDHEYRDLDIPVREGLQLEVKVDVGIAQTLVPPPQASSPNPTRSSWFSGVGLNFDAAVGSTEASPPQPPAAPSPRNPSTPRGASPTPSVSSRSDAGSMLSQMERAIRGGATTGPLDPEDKLMFRSTLMMAYKNCEKDGHGDVDFTVFKEVIMRDDELVRTIPLSYRRKVADLLFRLEGKVSASVLQAELRRAEGTANNGGLDREPPEKTLKELRPTLDGDPIEVSSESDAAQLAKRFVSRYKQAGLNVAGLAAYLRPALLEVCQADLKIHSALRTTLEKRLRLAEDVVLLNESNIKVLEQEIVSQTAALEEAKARLAAASASPRKKTTAAVRPKTNTTVRKFAKQMIEVQRQLDQLATQTQRAQSTRDFLVGERSPSRRSGSAGAAEAAAAAAGPDPAPNGPAGAVGGDTAPSLLLRSASAEFGSADADRNGKIDRHEFQVWLQEKKVMMKQIERDQEKLELENERLRKAVEGDNDSHSLGLRLKQANEECELRSSALRMEKDTRKRLEVTLVERRAALEALRARREQMLSADLEKSQHLSLVQNKNQAWEAERAEYLKEWGNEVETLIKAFRSDQALWEAERAELMRDDPR